MKMHENAPKGFTLIELLVVISLIAILTTLLLPAMGMAKTLAQRTVCAANLHHVNLGFELYRHDNNGFYPAAQDPASGIWLWMGRGFRTSLNQYLDSENGKISVLTCPVDRSDAYEYTSYAYSMCFYHSPAQINSITDKSGTYSNPLSVVLNRASDVKTPSGKILCGEWASNHEALAAGGVESGWWSWDGSRNFLFADGSIDFIHATGINSARDGLPDPNLTIDGIEGADRR